MECKAEIITHLDGEFGTIACIKRDLSNIANSFINIGFRLDEADVNQFYKEKGYKDIYEMAEKELDMKKSVVSRYMNVYRRFHSLEGKRMNIRARYKNYNYSQLCEMLPLKDDEIKSIGINENMTVAEIRQAKNNYKKGGNAGEENERCDVATDEKEETKEESENTVIDVEFKEVKKHKTVNDVMSFVEFYNRDGLDLLANIETNVKNNTKKECVQLIYELIDFADKRYREYLRKELGE